MSKKKPTTEDLLKGLDEETLKEALPKSQPNEFEQMAAKIAATQAERLRRETQAMVESHGLTRTAFFMRKTEAEVQAILDETAK